MTYPEPSITVKVDLTNPGQFFACCGLLELADRLWPGAEGWFEGDQFHIACVGTLDELMEEVGVDVTRYFFINRSMSSHLNFDLTLAKTQSEENPVYYVQYAHARICSILRHAIKEGYNPKSKADLTLLDNPEEIDLIKILMAFPRIVTEAAFHFEPHRIPAYLEEVATVYHRFQHTGKRNDTLRVVTDNKPLTLARLALCRATQTVLANGLSLLGISKPEKM